MKVIDEEQFAINKAVNVYYRSGREYNVSSSGEEDASIHV